MNTPRVDTKISWVQGDHRRGVKLQGTKIVNMLQLGCNACQILPWLIRSKKLGPKLHEIYTMLRSRDKGQTNKRSLTFCTGVKFSSWFDFIENGLKLIGSSS